jgi:serine/threonine protein kinase
MEAIRPERFGRYVLLDRIAEGGMAEVFRAIIPGAEGFRRTLVIKRILGHLSQSPKFVDMFVREARICGLLSHPSVVQVYDFGCLDGHYFLAMEYLRGHDVLAILRQLRRMKRQFPISVAVYVAREVAACLGYAHALCGPDGGPLHIVHRDVSPSNVMCLREGGVKLLDFGIASAVSEIANEQTDQGTFKGKLAYVAPERMRNEPLDGRSDLYSLGVMLWEMLTCRRLFRGSSEAETFKNVLEMPVPPPSTLRSEVPLGLDAIVLKMLERNRDERYQSGQALADDLEEVLRETKLHSRQLPSLLVDLFGSSTHSSQVAMSMVSPDLLLSGDPSVVESEAMDARTPSLPSAPPRRRWPLWAGIGAGTCVLAAALAWGMLRGDAPVPELQAPPAIAIPRPEPQPPVPPAPPPAMEADPASPPEQAMPQAPSKAGKALARRRPNRNAASAPRLDAIANGRSIDPFAEADRRGHR